MADTYQQYVNTELPLRPSADVPVGGDFLSGLYMKTTGVGMKTVPSPIKFGDNIVVVAKSGGDFTEIQDAIDSIDDAAEDNIYVIQVYPGTYTQRVTSTKNYVYIMGTDPNLCFLSPIPTVGAEDCAFKITSTTAVYIFNLNIGFVSIFPEEVYNLVAVKIDTTGWGGYFTNCVLGNAVVGGTGCTSIALKYTALNQVLYLIDTVTIVTHFDFLTTNVNAIEFFPGAGSSGSFLDAERCSFYLAIIDAMTGSMLVDRNTYAPSLTLPCVFIRHSTIELQGGPWLNANFTGTLKGFEAIGTKTTFIFLSNLWKFFTTNNNATNGTAYGIYADPSSTGMVLNCKQNIFTQGSILNTYFARLKAGVTLSSILDDYYDMSGKVDVNGGTFNDNIATYIANGTYWSGSPTTIKDAMDRIASAVYTLRGNSPIP